MIHQNSGSPHNLPIKKRIDHAYDLCFRLGQDLREDPTISELLHRLRANIEATQKTMQKLGVSAECKHCEEEEGGSCCGSGIENRYDVALLLINLLLGASLKCEDQRENSCYFLGQGGCVLLSRHVLCVNYLCEKLQKTLPREQLITLQTCAGEELETEFILHEAIKKHLNR